MGKEVTVELKNDMCIHGHLESVDQFLNMKLTDIHVVDEERYPHMVYLILTSSGLLFLFTYL